MLDRMAAMLFHLLVLAPALDFLAPARVPVDYQPAVAQLEALAVCNEQIVRPVKASAHSLSDLSGGDRLVRPVAERRVPIEAGYKAHFDLAKGLGFPFSDPSRQLSADLLCASKFVLHSGADGTLQGKRRHIQKTLRRVGSILRPHSMRLNFELMPADVYKISSGVNVLMLAAMVDAFNLPDKDVARSFWMGFQALGVIPDTFVHRSLGPAPPSQLRAFEREYAAIMHGNEAWADEAEHLVTRRNTAASQSAATRARLDAITATTAKELGRGLISTALTRRQVITKFGRGNYRVMIRTAIWQGGKWRCIDDGRRSLSNNASLLVETIATPTFEFPLWIARAIAREAASSGVLMPELLYGLDDLLAAFRTIPTSEHQFNLFAVWNPTRLRVEYHYTFGFVFGLKSSVTQFNRYPEVTTAVARKLSVPVAHFFDDYQIVDVRAGGNSAQDLVFEVHRQIGDGLDSDEARRVISAPAIELDKRKPMATSNIGLGVEVDLSSVHTRGIVLLSPSSQAPRA